jgi:ABC-2 type transport system permease protein
VFAIYWHLFRAALRARLQYKLDFCLSAVANAIIMAVDYVLLAAILIKFRDVKGWTLAEVGLLYGCSTISFSIYRMISPELHNFEKYLIQGELDQLLIRPVSPLMLLLARDIDLSRIGGIVQGWLILLYSLFHLSLPPLSLLLLCLYLPIILLSGFLISGALGLATATIGFWTQKIKDFQALTLYAPFNAANFPLSIYPGWLKGILFSILPVGFMNYLPLTALLHKGGQLITLFLSPLCAIGCLALAVTFWNQGIKNYHSTGS